MWKKCKVQVRVLTVFALLAHLLGVARVEAITFSDSGFFSETVTTLAPFEPVGLTFAPDGRIFVWQRDGVIRIVKNGVLLPTPFLDFSNRVNTFTDRGFLGVALDPNFATNGDVYLLYTYEGGVDPNDAGPKTSRLSRVTADPVNPDVVLANSEVVILGTVDIPPCGAYPVGTDCIPAESYTHSVGTLRFAPDGTLFISNGEGAIANGTDVLALRAQNLDSYAGKILRITPDGFPPTTPLVKNPFDNGTNSIRSKVWAYGLRNPFRFALHPLQGVPYIGDVGWETIEEVNKGVAGANYGWPCYEGTPPQPAYQAAFAACQALAASAVTPPIFSYVHGSGTNFGNTVIGGAFFTGAQYPTQYAGNLFFAEYTNGWIKRIVFNTNGTVQNVAHFASNIGNQFGGPVTIELGPDGLLYYIVFTTGEIARIRHTSGTGSNFPPQAVATATPSTGYAPLNVAFSSNGSSDPEGGVLTYLWNFGDGGTANVPNPSHAYTAVGVTSFNVTLTVTDVAGASATASTIVTVGSLPPVATIQSPLAGIRFTAGQTVQFQGTATDADDGVLPNSALKWTVLLHHNTHIHPYIEVTGAGGSFVIENHDPTQMFAYEFILTVKDSSGLEDTKSITVPVDPPPPGSVLLYGMNEGSGTVVGDSSGSGHGGTLVNGPTWAVGQATYGQAVSFDGVDDAVTVANPGTLNWGTADFTLAVWVKRNVLGGGQRHILSKCTATGWAMGCKEFYFNGNNQLIFGSFATSDTVSVAIADTNWHHVAVTFTDSTNTVRMYMDGTLRTTATKALEADGAGHVVTVGNLGGSNPYSGLLDELRIYSGVLSQAEIQTAMQTPLSPEVDTTPPVLTNGQPAGTLPAGTMQTTLGVATNEGATCRYSTTAGVAYANMTTTFSTTGGVTHATTVGGLSNGQTYTYYVRCQDGAGNATGSDFGITFSVTVPDTTVPTVPTALIATVVGSGQINLAWGASTDSGGSGLSGYHVERCQGGGCTSFGQIATPSTPSYANTGLTANTSYSYRVRAGDGAGNVSGYTAVVSATTQAAGGLVVAYGMNEGSGTVVGDSSGSGHGGTLVNGPTWAVGQATYGQAVSFDGVDDAVTVANPGTLNWGTADFTLAVWVKRNVLGGGQRHILSKCTATGWAMGCKEFYFNGNNQLIFGSFATSDTVSVAIADTNWHHVAVTFTDSTNTVRMYMDGTLRTTATKALEADGAGHVVTVGNLGGSNPYSGLLDELRIYSGVLSQAEIQTAMQTPLSPEVDTTPPVLTNGQPAGTLPAGTMQTTLGVATNEGATCRYSTTAGVAYANMTTTFSTTGGVTHATTVGGLSNGQTYTYYVRCQDGAGNATGSDFGITFSVTVPDTTVPTVPTALIATVVGSGQINLAWGASTDSGGSGLSGYHVERCQGGGCTSFGQIATPSTPSYANTGLTANTSYSYRVRAGDGAGNVSGYTAVVSATTQATVPDTTVPTVPTALIATVVGSGQINLAWGASTDSGGSGLSGYHVERCQGGGCTSFGQIATPSTPSYANTGLTANTSYSYRVRAGDGAGNVSGYTAVVSATTQAAGGLVVAYGMNEGSGTVVGDSSGSGHGGTLVNGPTWAVGQATYGQAVSFDGVDDAVTVANPGTLNWGTADFTLAVWVKRNVLGGGQRHILSKCTATGWAMGCKEFYFKGNNQLTFGSFATSDTVSVAIADTNWHHVAVTFTDSTNTVRMYVDGTLRTTATKALEADGAGHVVTVGNLGGSNPYSGLLDELRIYSGVLSQAQIQTVMQTPLSPN